MLILASDATAVIGRAKNVIYLKDDDLIVCHRHKAKVSYEISSMNPDGELVASFDTDDEEQPPSKKSRLDKRISTSKKKHLPQVVIRKMHALELSLEKIEKGGYKHFMLKEIMEQPKCLRDCMRGRVNVDTGTVKLGGLVDVMPKIQAASRILICACGTSYHSALVGEYLIESLAKVPVEVEYASEFRYRNPIIRKTDVVIVISQSGETADTLEAIKIAKQHGALTIGFVNVVGSSIARTTDAGCYLHVGPEIGVASTKAFTGQVCALTMFALYLAQENKTLNEAQMKHKLNQLAEMPGLIERVLEEDNCRKIMEISRSYRYAHNFLYLGRGYNFPVALEGALKLKEISYIHAEGYVSFIV